MIKKNIGMILIQFLLVITMVFYLIGRAKGLPVMLFWPIVWALIFVSFIIVYKLPKKYKLISLIILTVGVSAIHLVALPEVYHTGRDEIFEAQFSSTIIEEGRWDPSLGKGFAENHYGRTPVLHFLLSFASLTTGLDSIVLLRYFFFILFRLIIVLFTFLLISTIIKDENSTISYLATLIFIGSAGMAFAGVTRRATASLFVILTIFTILKTKDSSNKAVWNVLFMFFSLLVVLADRSISYYFLIFLIGAWLFSKLLKLMVQKESKIFPNIFPKLLYFIIVLFVWMVLSNKVFIRGDIGYVTKITDIIFSWTGTKSFLNVQETAFGVNIYHFYETFIIYSAQLLFLLLGAIGLFLFIKYLLKKKNTGIDHKYFLLYFALFGFIMYISSSFLMRTELGIAVVIFLWFACIPISIFVAYFLEFIVKKLTLRTNVTYIAIILLCLFTGSLLMGMYTPRITNRAPGEDIVIELDSRSKTEELYYSGLWLENNHKNQKLVGDINTFEIFSGFFQFDMNTYPESLKELYLGNKNDILNMIANDHIDFGSYEKTRQKDKLDYFIINNAFLRYYSILFGDPISQNNLEKFDKISLLDKVYNNNEIQLYKIKRGT